MIYVLITLLKLISQRHNGIPTIVINNQQKLTGIGQIVDFYQNLTSITNLIEKSTHFDQLNPDYTITLPYTHKNLKYVAGSDWVTGGPRVRNNSYAH